MNKSLLIMFGVVTLIAGLISIYVLQKPRFAEVLPKKQEVSKDSDIIKRLDESITIVEKQGEFNIWNIVEEDIKLPSPNELIPLETLKKNERFYNSAQIELQGKTYKEISVHLQQKPDEVTSNAPSGGITFFAFSPHLTPNLFYQNDYCKHPGEKENGIISGISVTVLRQDCSGVYKSYGYWFDYGTHTIGFRAHVDISSQQLDYLKSVIAAFIKYNPK